MFVRACGVAPSRRGRDVGDPARARLAVMATLFLLMAGANLPTAFYDAYGTRFGISPLVLSALYAVYALTVILGLPVFGRLSDRVGRRPLLALGMLAACAGDLCFAAAASPAWLFAGRVLQGMSIALASGTGTAALAELSGDRATAAVMATSSTALGSSLGPLLGGLSATVSPWADGSAFVAFALLSVAVAGGVLACVPAKRSLAAAAPDRRPDRGETRAVLASGVYRVACGTGFLTFAVPALFMSLGPAFVSSALGVHSPIVGGVMAFGLMGSSALAQLAVRRRRASSPMQLGNWLMAVGTLAFDAGVAGSSAPVIALAIVLSGVGQGFAFAGCVESVNRVAPAASRGFVTSVLYIAIYVGGGGAALCLGVLMSVAGTAAALDVISAAIFAAVAVLAAPSGIQALRAAARAAKAGGPSNGGRKNICDQV